MTMFFVLVLSARVDDDIRREIHRMTAMNASATKMYVPLSFSESHHWKLRLILIQIDMLFDSSFDQHEVMQACTAGVVSGRADFCITVQKFCRLAMSLFGRKLLAVCKFHQALHGGEVAENYGTWWNVSTAPRMPCTNTTKRYFIHFASSIRLQQRLVFSTNSHFLSSILFYSLVSLLAWQTI
jgi:hypothetical protein